MWLRGDLDQRWCPGGPGRDALRGLGWGEPRALSLSGEVPEAPSPALSTPRDVGLNWGHRNGGCLGVAGGLKGEGASASPQRGLAQEIAGVSAGFSWDIVEVARLIKMFSQI